MPNKPNTFYIPYRASLTNRSLQSQNIANAKGSAIKNAGGTIFYGGLITPGTSAPFTSTSASWYGVRSGFNGSQPYLSYDENTGTFLALSSGNFAQMTPGRYVLFGYNQFLAGVANSILNSPGAYGRNTPGEARAQAYVRSTHYVLGPSSAAGLGYEFGTQTGGWDYVTGFPKATQGTTGVIPISYDYVGTSASGQMGSYLFPGRLSFMYGAKTALVTSYSNPKTD